MINFFCSFCCRRGFCGIQSQLQYSLIKVSVGVDFLEFRNVSKFEGLYPGVVENCYIIYRIIGVKREKFVLKNRLLKA